MAGAVRSPSYTFLLSPARPVSLFPLFPPSLLSLSLSVLPFATPNSAAAFDWLTVFYDARRPQELYYTHTATKHTLTYNTHRHTLAHTSTHMFNTHAYLAFAKLIEVQT